jgi:hypothetical protein
MTRLRIRTYLALWLAIGGFGAAQTASAASFSYPVNDCVDVKQTQVGTYCMKVLKAWATFDGNGDTAKRDTAIQAAAATLAFKWSAAETKASKKGANCTETTLSVTDAQGLTRRLCSPRPPTTATTSAAARGTRCGARTRFTATGRAVCRRSSTG